jgi:FdhD protein
MIDAQQPVTYTLVEASGLTQQNSEIIVETPVSLTVNGEVWLTFMCTPVDLEALAVGFLYNEGLIESIDEVADVRLCPAGDNVDVWLLHSVEKPEKWQRTSGCTGGFTSVAPDTSLAEVQPLGNEHLQFSASSIKPAHPLNGLVLSSRRIAELVGDLFAAQDLYRRSGGVHTSALSDSEHFLVVTEDIGRHNTLDKIAGRCLIERISPTHRILITTGRISSEMIQKANRIGATIVISRTSPSSLSIQIAEKQGITLIGYARRDRFNLYTHPERIFVPDILHETIT